ncbi:23S rRNA (adenine(1618)-N(6))-methyltransferase RlmF [Aestuariirhabdus litorea]|uniref:Ribosomal RNA large subunit methyltransferase F n=1 Tax=Aestuariirhabdus litorea TaxID=2528527 RepID=A0A3P3VSJ2_9GAMM|nr:23S rRNA (adenine(1618)-N(6))-methyltransferase RlmF [Aestuariirhabdus litorea]RRJ83763.1 23S rRNA (adenine(1618)-N(6))-methyltransferase RlmF [Aestuariirhabdus litorea]RWW96986.1 23S rRNA (adenine(1618)-N(6))-methyltransferase RlmF [Endozoicomonadaceae bacterium GTF-13]
MPRPPHKPKPARSAGGAGLHPRNLHQGRYDLAVLVNHSGELAAHLTRNPRGETTIDFSDADAVRCLNQALLAHYYGIQHWQLPPGYLCPPIPGRADLVHHAADLLARSCDGTPPTGRRIRVLDIGTGANCIYPLLANRSYGWRVTGSDIDPVSIAAAQAIVEANPLVRGNIELVLQREGAIFEGLLASGQRFHLSLCNPPFYASEAQARAANQRKRDNLARHRGERGSPARRNFGGQRAELWCPGGERRFLQQMITESRAFGERLCWFSSLVSNGDNLHPLKRQLRAEGVRQLEVIPMGQGQKQSRLLAWSFLTPEQQRDWVRESLQASG